VRPALAVAIVAVLGSTPPLALHAQGPAVEGGWIARDYALATGATHEVRGQIHFDESRWMVLFFVMDGETAARGSAEGGRYTLDGDTITFEHLHHLSVGEALEGLPASPLRMETRRDGALEPARVEVDGDELTLHFPSGNRMRFVRGPDQ
jgi:hypothetical protein